MAATSSAMAPALTEATAGSAAAGPRARDLLWRPEAGGRRRGLGPEQQPSLEREAAALRGRQAALWGRARRLCRRLQVVRARQVERHVRQQLAGLWRHLAPGAEPPAPAPPPVARAAELQRLVGSATALLRAVQRDCDSDATDTGSGSSCCSSGSSSIGSGSSSSSSSCSSGAEEEEEETALQSQAGPGQPPRSPPPPAPSGYPKAEWQWALERAAIICRWTWLQAQVSDLEYRIRQQTDIYKQLRANKGPVVLGEAQQSEDWIKQECRMTDSLKVENSKGNWRLDSAPYSHSLDPHDMDKQSPQLTQSLGSAIYPTPSFHPINGTSGLQKDHTATCHINGVINCSRSNSLDSNSHTEETLSKRKRLESPATSLSPYDSSCIAARIRPLCKYRKRKLLRTNTVSYLSRKPQKPLTMKCSCEWPHTCILCECKTSLKPIDVNTMTLKERIAVLDSGFHPILSLPHGSPLHLHFEALLKEDRLTYEAMKMSPLMKGSQVLTATYPVLTPSLSPTNSPLKEGRHLKGSAASPSMFASSLQTLKPSPLEHSLSPYIVDSSAAPSSSQPSTSSALQTSKKKRSENSYDIDNIVIPMSMATGARVEKLQYKEILTPSWRLVESKEQETLNQMDLELEDTSDDAYRNRHAKYEELERARWDSWTAAAISHRRGNNRSSNKGDGRGTQSIPATSLAVSPDTAYHNFNDLAHSSAGTSSPEPCSLLQSLSIKDRTPVPSSCSEDTCSTTTDIGDDAAQIVQPWERRTFPLSDTSCQAILDQPNKLLPPVPKPWCSSRKPNPRTQNSPPESRPIPSSLPEGHFQANSSSCIEEFTSHECFSARLLKNR
ncbi:KAT8 regulatory NSL complex subunit 1-like isoform X3 [Petaurus breviceps papuanus]|uniref:KAT8 regulatory NSL complex subunit 1-like isoform X3 n=1 Tax=Petaurus breviceps papuanus TaxID=3040969 RepID=UPI0036D8039F